MADLNTRARDALAKLHRAEKIRFVRLQGMEASDPDGCPDTSDPLTLMGLLLLLEEAGATILHFSRSRLTVSLRDGTKIDVRSPGGGSDGNIVAALEVVAKECP